MRTEVIWKRKAWKAETRIKIYFKYKLSGTLLISGQLPCHTVFFCCPQEISLLVSFFVALICSFQPAFTFPDLYRTDILLYFLHYLCVSEASMLMFLLLMRKGKYSKNKKRSCLCHRDLFFWGGGVGLYLSATCVSEKNQIGIIVDFLSLELGRGNTWNNKQDCASEWEG